MQAMMLSLRSLTISRSTFLRTLSTTAPATADNITGPVVNPEIDSKGRIYSTGRRKESTARVWIMPGQVGKLTKKSASVCVCFRI